MYLVVLLEAARSAAAATLVAVVSTYELRVGDCNIPCMRLATGPWYERAPSGLLPSDRDRPRTPLRTDIALVLPLSI